MPNKNYQRGVRFERERIEHHKKHGATIVSRTAGSHSGIDVFAINEGLRTIWFEQCKTSNRKLSYGVASALRDKLPIGGKYYVIFSIQNKVITRRRKKK